MHFNKTDHEHIWHPFSALLPNENLLVKSGNGAEIHLEDGRVLIDAVASWWVNLFGHANEELAEVLYKQAQTLEHVIFAGFTHAPATGLVEELLKIAPVNQKRFFFSDNGSTAVEVAVKLAIQYWHNIGQPKTKIVTLEGGYHGDTFGSMSMAGKSAFFTPFETLLFEVEQIPFPDEQNKQNAIQQFEKLVAKKDVAAFVYEPLVQGSAGMRIYDQEVLASLVNIAKEHDVLCVADEVMTGFGRTGKYFASQHIDTPPDLMAMSKGITGGFMALGVTSCSAQIEEAFLSKDKEKIFYHGHSYTANALACAVAVRSTQMLQREETQQNIHRINGRHLKVAEDYRKLAQVKQVKVQGTILSIEIETGQQSSYFSNIRDVIYNEAIANGILLRPLGNVIYVLPPYVITDEQLGKVYDFITTLLDKLEQ